MIRGDYGISPAPIAPEFVQQILKNERRSTARFADSIPPQLEQLKAQAAPYTVQPEDVLTYAMFPQVAQKFFERRKEKMLGIDADHVDYQKKSHPI